MTYIHTYIYTYTQTKLPPPKSFSQEKRLAKVLDYSAIVASMGNSPLGKASKSSMHVMYVMRHYLKASQSHVLQLCNATRQAYVCVHMPLHNR